MPYARLIASTWRLWREEPVLREACLFGGLSFGAFGAFWMTLAFYLEGEPFHYGPDETGLFGVLAAAGAVTAGYFGRLADRIGPRPVSVTFLVVTLVSFAGLWWLGGSVWGLALGVIGMDVGIQAIHVCNQTRVYRLRPEARNRLGTVYIVSYFAGGSLGASLGVWSWTQAGWTGVCGVGASMLALGVMVAMAGPRRAAMNGT
jgi:predicted MFS family arabinose efflux permease